MSIKKFKDMSLQQVKFDYQIAMINYNGINWLITKDQELIGKIFNNPPGFMNKHIYFLLNAPKGTALASVGEMTNCGHYYIIQSPYITGTSKNKSKIFSYLIDNDFYAIVGINSDGNSYYFDQLTNNKDYYDILSQIDSNDINKVVSELKLQHPQLSGEGYWFLKNFDNYNILNSLY